MRAMVFPGIFIAHMARSCQTACIASEPLFSSRCPSCMAMKFVIALFSSLIVASAACATAPATFTAHYQVLKKGDPIGEAVMRLSADGNSWVYTTRTRGEHGLAGLLGMTTEETSRFRLRGGHTEMLSYDYRLDAGVKKRQRNMQVDWSTHRVQVHADGKNYSYAAAPDLVERHLLPLVLGTKLGAGQRDIALPVAVKDRVETQHFRVEGLDSIKVPVGHMNARLVRRIGAGKNFVAWYVPKRYATPIKMTYGDYTLLLKSWTSP